MLFLRLIIVNIKVNSSHVRAPSQNDSEKSLVKRIKVNILNKDFQFSQESSMHFRIVY